MDKNVRSTTKNLIPPHTSISVPAILSFASGSNYAYVKKVFSSDWSLDHGYVPPDSLISKQIPQLSIAKFSTATVTIQVI